MKVGLIVPGYSADAGDPGIPVLADVVRELARRVELHIFALRYPYRRKQYEVHGAHIHALGGATSRGVWRGFLVASAWAALIAEHRRARFDLFHGVWADEPGFLAVWAGRALGIPSMVSVMGGELVGFPDIGYGGRLNPLNRRMSRFALRGASLVTAGAASGVALARQDLRPEKRSKVERLVWGIDPGLFDRGFSDPPRHLPGSFRVLHVASLLAVKDQSTLLRAFARLKGAEPGAHLHVAGDGPLRASLLSLATALGVVDAVTFHGHVDRKNLHAFYCSADVLAITSRHEAQSAVALEAGLCGLPIVGTAVGVVTDLAPESAIAVPVGGSGALADALTALLDPDRRRALAGAAHTLVRSQYLAGDTAERLASTYGQLARDYSGELVRSSARM